MKEMDVKTKRRQTREKIQITHAEKQKRAKRVTDVRNVQLRQSQSMSPDNKERLIYVIEAQLCEDLELQKTLHKPIQIQLTEKSIYA